MQLTRLDTARSCLLALAAAAALGAIDASTAQAAPPSGGQPAPSEQPPGSPGTTNSPGSPPAANGFEVPTGLLVHQIASFHGRLPGARQNETVSIERLDPAGQAWTPIAHTTTAADGTFTARWRADHIGQFTLRAVSEGAQKAAATAQATSDTPTAKLTVYRAATASWFGPGFYNKQTACGQTMSPTLQGVAHKSLPCGTEIQISYAGHSVTVPVVDRGPYRRGVSWDLTTATAQSLGITETVRVGALALRGVFGPPSANGFSSTPPSSSGGAGTSGQSGGTRAA